MPLERPNNESGTYRNVQGDQIQRPEALRAQAVGGPVPGDLIQGLDGVIRELSAATVEMRSLTAQVRLRQDQEARMQGLPGLPPIPGRVPVPGMTAGGVLLVPPLAESPARIVAPPPPGLSSPYTPSPAATGQARLPDDQAYPGAPSLTTFEEYQRMRGLTRDPATGGFSLAGLQRTAGGGLARMYQRRLAETTAQMEAMRERFQLTPEDEGVPLIPPGIAQEASDLALQERRYTTLAGAGQGLASGDVSLGGTVMNFLPRMAGRAAGIAGAVFTVGQQVADYAGQQRAVNAAWQRITGESNLAAVRERQKSQFFEWSMKGTLGAEEASQLYMGVGRAGLAGGRRQDAMDFAVDQYRRLGMTVEQSLEVINVAASRGIESFAGLAEQLDRVTDSARASGMNAEVAREQFVRTLNTATNVFTGGTGVAVAGAISQSQALLGQQFQGVNFGGMMGPTNMYMQAAAAGMPLGPYMARLNRDPSGVLAARGQQQHIQQLTTGLLAQGGGAEVVSRFVREQPRLGEGGDDFSDAQYQELANQLQDAGVDPNLTQTILSQVGGIEGLTWQNAVQFLGQVEVGRISTAGWDPTAQAVGAREASRVRRVNARTRETARQASQEGGALGGQRLELRKLQQRLFGEEAGGGRAAYAQDIYMESVVSEQGFTSPIIQSLLTDFDPERRFRVQTKEGEAVVTMDDALRYYADQLARGEAEVVAGRGQGQTVSRATGIAGDKLPRGVRDTRESAMRGKQTQKYAEWYEEFSKEGGGGRVLIEASPELLEYIRITASGAAYTDPANALVPPPAYPGNRAKGPF